MRFWKKQKKGHIRLLGNAAALGAFFLLRGNRALMDALADRVTTPLKRALGRLCAHVSFSVAEVLTVALLLAAAVWLVWSAIAVFRAKGRRLRRAYGALLTAANAALTLYAIFCLLWGVNYQTTPFAERAGLRDEGVRVEELTKTCAYFAKKLGETAQTVPRDARGVFCADKGEILRESANVYRAVEREYPFLAMEDAGAKAVHFSRAMSAIGFTGFYCPFTGESNLNVDAPACLLPATVAHELAHQRAVASEKECNFLAVLACTTCGKAEYVYSGWLSGFVYLGNALYSVDPDAYRAIYAALPEQTRADLADNRAYWRAFQDTTAERVSEKVYDGMLRSYGDQNGTRSYGMVVDLLVARYRDAE